MMEALLESAETGHEVCLNGAAPGAPLTSSAQARPAEGAPA